MDYWIWNKYLVSVPLRNLGHLSMFIHGGCSGFRSLSLVFWVPFNNTRGKEANRSAVGVHAEWHCKAVSEKLLCILLSRNFPWKRAGDRRRWKDLWGRTWMIEGYPPGRVKIKKPFGSLQALNYSGAPELAKSSKFSQHALGSEVPSGTCKN